VPYGLSVDNSDNMWMTGCRLYVPYGLSVDNSDNVWVTDIALHQVCSAIDLSAFAAQSSASLDVLAYICLNDNVTLMM